MRITNLVHSDAVEIPEPGEEGYIKIIHRISVHLC
jgi:hypothetical protein